MRYTSINALDHKANSILAEVRALKLAVIYGAISYDKAKEKAETLIRKANAVGKRIAEKHKMKYKRVQFSDL